MTPSRPQVDLSKFKRLDLAQSYESYDYESTSNDLAVFSIKSPRPYNGRVAERLSIIAAVVWLLSELVPPLRKR